MTTKSTRWLEGLALTLGPTLLLAGVATRFPFDDFFPGQLAAYAERPTLMTVSHGLFTVGIVLLIPAVIALARRIEARRIGSTGWAFWGAVLTVLGLVARIFHAGVNHLAFRLVDAQGVDAATKAVAETYGAFHVFKAANVAIMAGWVVLAIGAHRSKTLNIARCVGLAAMAALPLGVLKGSSDPISIVAIVGLMAALVPLGIKTLKTGPAPKWWAVALTAAAIPAAVLLGVVG